MKRFLARCTLVLLILLSLGPTASAAQKGVSIKSIDPDNDFDPDPIEVTVGDSIIWTNDDPTLAHTATGESFNTGNLDSGEPSDPITFSSSGDFAYVCAYHSTMRGTVVVKAAPSQPPPTTSPKTSPSTKTSPFPSPTQSPSPEPTESPTEAPAESPTPDVTGTPVTAVAIDEDDEGGGISGGVIAAIVALLVAAAAGGGLWWMRRTGG